MPSRGFLLVCAGLAALIAAVAWLSVVGGCEDAGSECHRSGGSVVLVGATVTCAALLGAAFWKRD